MTGQRQDLLVFSDQSVISRRLLQDGMHHLIMVPHRLGTSPRWLISALAEAFIFGTPVSLNEQQSAAAKAQRPHNTEATRGPAVTVASFMHDAAHYQNVFSKLKLPSQAVRIVDVFTDLVKQNIGKPGAAVLERLLESIPDQRNGGIIIEQPEVLLSLFRLTSDELHLNFINPLMKKCAVLVVVTSVDGFDGGDYERASKDAIEFMRFPTAAFHKSIAVLSLRPLDTGRAKDVTGILQVTQGGSLEESDVHVVENEYLFHVQKESIKLFYR
ncbi:AGL338Wp [Eremothecium gossypii ATCC 10895]|uniref:AGL338Wp n=1 Tax=Eremothecium gossypii (strain ATCC 10895 / CBS 109.51 / FGSC 9923 / NRRL Y-1056) TaxID=284811 RepID=Q751N5_EREGS|nr:AGL338Wp [Eremothecium gossypii ATCC 10895]AAS54153.1 AGL338Wp [Eremothecium gossypii ATCC 10895]AEY98479.1 FAGL338Wp [Eremothecium gossypii FDAG1]